MKRMESNCLPQRQNLQIGRMLNVREGSPTDISGLGAARPLILSKLTSDTNLQRQRPLSALERTSWIGSRYVRS